MSLMGAGEDEADSETLYQASCRAMELDAMARTLALRVEELQALNNTDADVDDDILKLTAQQYTFREIASQLRCTKNKTALSAAFGAAAMAQALFGIAKSTADHAMKDGEHERSSSASNAVAAAKASYAIPFLELRARSQYRIEHVLRDARIDEYRQYTGFPIHQYMKDPSTTDVLKDFKTALDEVDTGALSAVQQHQVEALHETLNVARINAFNITDTNVDTYAAAAAGRALGDRFAGQFAEYNDGQTVEAFLTEARMQRGFSPVSQEAMNGYTRQITMLTLKQESAGLTEFEQADLECYKAAFLRAEAVNAYFESQRELKTVTTLRAQMELVIVQENLLKLENLPPEAIEVHLQEAAARLEKLKTGTVVTGDDVDAAVLRIQERLGLVTGQFEAQAETKKPLILSEAAMEEVKAAAKGICICNSSVTIYPFALNRFSAPALELA